VRLNGVQEAPGSNPGSPIKFYMYFVYILRSQKTGRRYVGSCQDLEARLLQHNSGHSTSTKHGTPWHLVYHEVYPSRAEAIKMERFHKTGKGRETLDRLDV
jgi:putative endonuclease